MTILSILLHFLLWSLQSCALSVPTSHDPTLDLSPYPGVVGTHESDFLLRKRQSSSDILIALYARGLNAEARKAAGIEAFHWGIHITPEGALKSEKTTSLFHVINQEENIKLFQYEKRTINPFRQRVIFARVKVGTLPATVSVDKVDELLSQVQAPSKLENPGDSCVTWAVCGIKKLQENGIIENFDTAGFADKVLEYGEQQTRALDDDEPEFEADEFDIGNYDAKEGKIIRQESVPCKRAGEPCINPNPKEKETEPAVEKPEDAELIAVAKEKSKENFDGLLEEFNYGSVVKQDKLYGELNARLPEFSAPRVERIAGFASKLGEGALAIGGLVLYGKAVADVFASEDASVLDKAAVVTSILPGIGCAVQLADDEQKGQVDVTHTALCFTEDALLVSGFWEIALVMQVGEEISNWIQAENERSKFWDGDLLAQKGAEGWLQNVKRLINHIKGDEFFVNATSQFATYQILTLYQASQLTGDLHATAKTNPQGIEADIHAHVQPELKRQICSVISDSKRQLQAKLEGIALNHTAKLEREFKNQFLDDWLKAATTPKPIFGITLPDFESNTKLIHEQVEKARNSPLQLYEKEVKAAIREVIERLPTPAPCQCDQGKKGGKCEFGGCQSTKPEGHPQDAGGRIYTANVQSIEVAKRLRLTDTCQALFAKCQGGEAGRALFCTPGK
ncbi:uncharacterized protein G6M90_00g045840 [Metarhizium brunneum]|uniref:Heat Labile Enterotoxin Type Iib n=1 Tax=Metarhizium brunneum TaxID=500148 RepID=A0A7D5UUS8_9HYPO